MNPYRPELVERAEIAPADPVPVRGMLRLRWGAPFPNFGDLLAPLIVKRLSGRCVTSHQRNFRRRKLFALGSSLGAARDGDMLWGTGSKGSRPKARRLDVRAVRGPKTRALLREYGIDCPEVFGDPAMLMPWVYAPDDAPIRSGIGIIPHYKDHQLVRSLQGVDLRWISVMDHPLRVIDAIRCCEVVLSSSLHGLVLAEAYGIPACFMETPVQVRLKYEDYYAATGRDVISYDYDGYLDPEAAARVALKSEPPALDLTHLLLAFPYLRTGILSLEDLKAFRIDDIDYKFDFPAEVLDRCHPDFQQCTECRDAPR